MFEYTINGICYTQKPLVLGQLVQLANIFSSLYGASEVNDFNDFIKVAGDQAPNLMAIILNPDGVKIKNKNLTQIADEMSENADLETMEAVFTDFFTCNPNTPSILEKSEMLIQIFGKIVGKMTLKFLSSNYASSLQEAILPSETTSNGDSQLKK